MGLSSESIWEFSSSIRTKFGEGSVEEVGYEAIRYAGPNPRVFVTTDPGVAKAGLLDKLLKSLDEAGVREVRVFDGVESEPSLGCFERAVAEAAKGPCDLFIGLGGGSALDVGKAVNIVTSLGGEVMDYVAAPTGGGKPISRRGKPYIAVPTTAGTGSEVSPVAVVLIPEKGVKEGMSSNNLRPDLAVVDPLLTLTLPPDLTAYTGMDALAHAVESYTALPYRSRARPKGPLERPVYTGRSELTELLALEAVRLIGGCLRRAVHMGYDREARRGMALASHLAGLAFTNSGVTACHALAYPVGTQFHASHGVANAVLLPAVVEFNRPSAPERFAEIARALGEPIGGLSIAEASRRCAEAIRELSRDIGIPYGLEALGVQERDIPRLASDAIKMKRILAGNPRRVGVEDIERIYRDSMRNY